MLSRLWFLRFLLRNEAEWSQSDRDLRHHCRISGNEAELTRMKMWKDDVVLLSIRYCVSIDGASCGLSIASES